MTPREAALSPSTEAKAGGARLSQGGAAGGLSGTTESDAALVARTLAGDLNAFAGLMARYRSALGRYALHMLGNREDAEEALQDGFVRAYWALATCRDPQRFGAWLFRIVVNRCRTVRRRRRPDDRAAVLPDDLPTRGGDVSEALGWREEISRALARLRPHYREAFLLRYVEGMDYDEISRLTGAKEPAIRMRVKRAGDQLRELLRDVISS
ncbi:MAG TPA: RNA polymerase sigma factor [Gemmatimonadales bacterium]